VTAELRQRLEEQPGSGESSSDNIATRQKTKVDIGLRRRRRDCSQSVARA